MSIVLTMNYGRETVSNFLRKAGEGLRDFDQRYADRAAADIVGLDKPGLLNGIEARLGGTSLSDVAQGYNYDTTRERLMGLGISTGEMITNAGYRYGLPAAGLTLAGKGLYDLTIGMNQQTEGTLQPSL